MNSTFLTNHPVNNFKRSDYSLEPEYIFGNSFSKFYRDNYLKIHSRTHLTEFEIIRELPIHGLGISDMVNISWKGSGLPISQILNPTNTSKEIYKIRAFEFKITDWKKGLLQAHRYNFYSHASILVLPLSTYDNALKALETFKKLRVGLWGFDMDKKVLKRAYTPRPNNSFSNKHYNTAKKKAFSFLMEFQPK